jgi:hypothetical protein
MTYNEQVFGVSYNCGRACCPVSAESNVGPPAKVGIRTAGLPEPDLYVTVLFEDILDFTT